jgi:hypothetical protein
MYDLLTENALLRSLNQVNINSWQMNQTQLVDLIVDPDPMNTCLPLWDPEHQ